MIPVRHASANERTLPTAVVHSVVCAARIPRRGHQGLEPRSLAVQKPDSL